MPSKKRIRIKRTKNVYDRIEEALENALGFALNRLEDVSGECLDEAVREQAKPQMLNELMIALSEEIDWERSE